MIPIIIQYLYSVYIYISLKFLFFKCKVVEVDNNITHAISHDHRLIIILIP